MKGDVRVPLEEICLLQRTELSREQGSFLGFMTYYWSRCLVEMGPVNGFWVSVRIKVKRFMKWSLVRAGFTPHVPLY